MKIVLRREIKHPAQRVWEIVSNFSDMSWNGRFSNRIDVEGEGAGMLRRVYLPGNPTPLVERLDQLIDETRQMRYTIVSGIAAPVSDFTVAVEIAQAGPGRCRITLAINFDAPESVAADMKILIENAYDDTLSRLERYLEQP